MQRRQVTLWIDAGRVPVRMSLEDRRTGLFATPIVRSPVK